MKRVEVTYLSETGIRKRECRIQMDMYNEMADNLIRRQGAATCLKEKAENHGWEDKKKQRGGSLYETLRCAAAMTGGKYAGFVSAEVVPDGKK